MAAEFAKPEYQIVQANQPVTLQTVIGCPKGYVYHRNGSGIVTLRGITPNCFARYQVTFNGNIAIPDGGTAPAGISIAVALDGEPILSSKAVVTPAATADDPPTTDTNFFNVTSTAVITVPKGCCFNVSVENTSESATPTTPAPPIVVKNANMTVARIA